jgi:uncharacterized delta-60 repeat protein
MAEPLESRRLLHAGEADLTFGTNGSTDIDFGKGASYLQTSVLMPDGGTLHVDRSGGGIVELAKLTATGKLDTSWGTGGLLSTSYQWGADNFADKGRVAVDAAHGRIALIAVENPQQTFNDIPDLIVLKLDGTVDTSFSGDGVVTFSDDAFYPSRLAFQSDGRLIVAGSGPVKGNQVNVLVRRYGANGVQDMSFGPSGGEIELLSPDVANDLEILSDDRIVVAGDYVHVLDIELGGDTFFGNTLHLLSADGDSIWDRSVASGSDNEEDAVAPKGLDLERAADGSILLLYSEGGSKLARYTADGTLDATFAPAVGRANEIEVDDEGRILVLDRGNVLRFNPNGTLDRSYGVNGVAALDIDTQNNAGTLVVQNGDQAVVAGQPALVAAPDYRVFRLQGGAGAPANAVVNRRGSLIVNSLDAAEELSLYIRGRDGRLIVRVGEFVKSFAPSRVKRIAVFTYGGDDTITIHDGVKGAYVDAGGGNDTINGGRGDDALLGGGGKDKIYGFDGNDTLLGGASNDYLLGGAGKDDLFGQGGIDTLSGAGGNDRLFGGSASDFCNGGNGSDAAAQSDEDTYDSVETMLTLA